MPIGTPAYMSPEQARGDKGLTTATDVYGIGAILYVLLAGRALYDGETPLEIINKVKTGEPKPLRSINRLVDLNLATICHKCLSAEPGHRYASVQYLSDDLNRWLDRKPINARRASLLERFDRWIDRNPYLVAACVCTIAILFGIGSLFAMSYRANTIAYRELEKQNYVNNITVAAQAAEDNKQLDLADRLIASMPRERETDHRGWEWHYLNRQATLDFVKHEPIVVECAVDPQGKAIVCTFPTIEFTEFRERRLFKVWTELSNGLGAMGAFTQGKPSYVVTTDDYYGFNPKWSPNGSYFSFVACTDYLLTHTRLRIWDHKGQSTYWKYTTPEGQSIASHAWSQDGKSIAVVLNDSMVHVLDVKSRSVINRIEVERSPTKAPNQSLGVTWISESEIAISGQDQCLSINTITGKQIKNWDFSVLDWSRDGERWVSHLGVGKADSSELVFKHPFSQAYWSHSASRIASVNEGRVSIVLPESGEETELISRPGTTFLFIGWLADDSGILVRSKTYGQVLCLRSQLPSRATPTYPLPSNGRASAIAASSNGQQVAVALDDSSTVLVLDEQGEELSKFVQHKSSVLAIDWQSQGELIATLDRSNQLFVWNSRTGEVVFKHELPKHESKYNSDTDYQVDWRHDGRFLAASANGGVLAWECGKWTLRLEMLPLKSNWNTNMRLSSWDLASGRLISEHVGTFQLSIPQIFSIEEDDHRGFTHLRIWDPVDNQMRGSSLPLTLNNAPGVTKLVNQPSKTGGNRVAIGYSSIFSIELHRFTVSGSNMLTSASTQSLGLRGKYDLEELSGRIFATDLDGSFVVADAETGTRLLEIAPGPIDAFDCENGKLWVASAGTITCYDGSPQPDRLRLPSRSELSESSHLQDLPTGLRDPNFLDRAAMGWGVITFLVLMFPMWLWSGMSFSTAYDRWFTKSEEKQLLRRGKKAIAGQREKVLPAKCDSTTFENPVESWKPSLWTIRCMGTVSILLGLALIVKLHSENFFRVSLTTVNLSSVSLATLEHIALQMIVSIKYSFGFAVSLLVLVRTYFVGPRWLSALAATLFLCFAVAYVQFDVANFFRFDVGEILYFRYATIGGVLVGAVTCSTWFLVEHWRAASIVLAPPLSKWRVMFSARPANLDWIHEAYLIGSLALPLFLLGHLFMTSGWSERFGLTIGLSMLFFAILMMWWMAFCMQKYSSHRRRQLASNQNYGNL